MTTLGQDNSVNISVVCRSGRRGLGDMTEIDTKL